MSEIPVIDFSEYGINVNANSVNESQLRKLSQEICDAFRRIGFIYLKNHGIEQDKISKAFSVSEKFFELPLEEKERYTRGPGLNNHGWVRIERERVNSEMLPDYKEAYDVNLMVAKTTSFEAWPSDQVVPGFQSTLESMLADCRSLAWHLLHLAAIGLELEDPHYFTKMFNPTRPTHTAFRSLHYPAMPPHTDMKSNQLRCAEHTDYGAITILFQDEVGGLEVFSRDRGDYVPAVPIPGTVVVNLGDMMQRWTADQLISTKHRVVAPPHDVTMTSPRQSLVCFVHPDVDAVVACIDSAQQDKYPPITGRDYLQRRFYETFEK